MRIFCVIMCFGCAVLAADEIKEKILERFKHEQIKSKRFNFPGGSPMGGAMPGGGGMSPSGGSPFHAGGPSHGAPMGMNPMGGAHGGPMQGPRPPGGMGSPGSSGHTSMFNPGTCLTQEIVCPPWCVMVDEFGCRSCPCGPGGGMVTGTGSFMSHMPSIGGSSFSHVSQSSGSTGDCIAVKLCKSTCPDNYVLSQMGSDGCPKCSCNAPMGAASGFSGGVMPGGGSAGGGIGGGSSGSFSGPFSASVGSIPGKGSVPFGINTLSPGSHTSTSTAIGAHTSYVVTKPKECRTEEVCREICGGSFELGEYGTDGCKTCICPPKEVVTYVQVQTLTCQTPNCHYGCSIGYKCGTDGCPTCECAKPSGYQVHEVVIQHQVQCASTFTCSRSCEVGYKCGLDGCPTCECLVGYVKPQSTTECYDCEWIDFLAPTAKPNLVSYVRPRPQTQTVYVTGTNGECHNCETTQPEVIYTQPKPQSQTVYLTGTNECHECETTHPQIIYQQPKPVYVTQTQYEKPKPVYITQTQYEKPKPVYVTQPECTDCGIPQQQTIYVERPQPQAVYVAQHKPKPQTVYLTQQQAKPQQVIVTGGSSSAGLLSVLTSGGSSYGEGSSGGAPYGIIGGSGGMASGSTGGHYNGNMISFNSGNCPPMPHDCDPSCIKWDEPHCRRCECENPFPQYSGVMHG